MSADIFSATAELINWLIDTPSRSATSPSFRCNDSGRRSLKAPIFVLRAVSRIFPVSTRRRRTSRLAAGAGVRPPHIRAGVVARQPLRTSPYQGERSVRRMHLAEIAGLPRGLSHRARRATSRRMVAQAKPPKHPARRSARSSLRAFGLANGPGIQARGPQHHKRYSACATMS